MKFNGRSMAWRKVLGSWQLTPEVRRKPMDGVHVKVATCSADEIAVMRDDPLLGLLELRAEVGTR